MYRIIQTNDQFHVVYAINGGRTVIRILNIYGNRDDAQQALTDLAGWAL